MSRAELSRRLGLSRSTVSGIVQALLDAGVVVESHVAPSGGGRPPIMLAFRDDAHDLLGVELGASHVSVVLTDLRGRILGRVSVQHPAQLDPAGSLALIERLARSLIRAGRPPLGAGIGVPSPLMRGASGPRLSPHVLPAWVGIDPSSVLRGLVPGPVFMDNDANLGALAEAWWGAGRSRGDFAYIKLATGVGAGLIVQGRIYGGASGIAGEIGHTTIDPNGPLCRCGLRGCLEAMVGTQALLARAAARLKDGAKSSLSTAANPDLNQLLDAARQGDPLATELLGTAGRYLGVAVANLVNLFNPSRVVLGGRLSLAGDLLLQPMRLAIHERALFTSAEEAEVMVTPLGPGAVALGAATRVLQEALDDPVRLLLSPPPASEGS